MDKKTIYLTLASTVFMSLFYFFLACVYHYTTSVQDPQHLFDFEYWSYPFRRDVATFSLSIIFIGVAAATIGNIIRVYDKNCIDN